MNIFVTNELKIKIKEYPLSEKDSILQLIKDLSNSKEDDIIVSPNVRHMTTEGPGLYLMRYLDYRIFFSLVDVEEERTLLIVDIVKRQDLFTSEIMNDLLKKTTRK